VSRLQQPCQVNLEPLSDMPNKPRWHCAVGRAFCGTQNSSRLGGVPELPKTGQKHLGAMPRLPAPRIDGCGGPVGSAATYA